MSSVQKKIYIHKDLGQKPKTTIKSKYVLNLIKNHKFYDLQYTASFISFKIYRYIDDLSTLFD